MAQRIGIYWFAEILNVICSFLSFRCCGKTELCCAAEVFQYFAPLRILSCAGTVAFVYNDEVEEIFGKVHIWLLLARLQVFFGFHPLLIERHIDFIARFRLFAFYLCHNLTEGLEILAHGLVYQDISVGYI